MSFLFLKKLRKITTGHYSYEKSMGLLNFLKDTIGIDPGSQYLRIIKDGELVFNELSQISIDKVNNVVSGVGN
ncbi:MAG: hypothetical protein ACKPEQ_41835, partial [Dolichospermum sp.]